MLIYLPNIVRWDTDNVLFSAIGRFSNYVTTERRVLCLLDTTTLDSVFSVMGTLHIQGSLIHFIK